MATIPLDLIPAFLAVAELGSFSTAAKRLGVEKSSISRAVARFEQGLGDRLFLRTTRRVSLTDAGRSVRDRLRDPHANLDAALRAVLDTASQPRGRIVVTTAVDFGSAILADALARFVRRHPHVEVNVRVSGQYLDLVSGGIDAAIRIAKRRLDDSTLTARKLGELRVGIFAAPSYLETHGVPRTPEEAASHQWVVFPGFGELGFRGPGRRSRVRPTGRVSCDDMTFVQSALVHGLGLGVLPTFLADADLRQGRLHQVLPGFAVTTSGSIWFLTSPTHRKTARTLDTLRDCITDVLTARGLV
jgi:DNA-binding transcriptional LysR family regulator